MTVASSPLSLHPLWSDGAVVQRDRPVRITGREVPGQRVRVTFRGEDREAVTDDGGAWTVTLPPGSAGGPFELKVDGQSRVTVRDVQVGDVWLASGQSNMEWRLNQCPQARTDAERAHLPQIRFCTLAPAAAPDPQTSVSAAWLPLTPSTAPHLSAVAFYFARRVQAAVGVPIGLVVSAWGGTPAETWIPGPAFACNATTRRIWAEYLDARDRLDERAREANRLVAEWEATHLPRDPGNTGLERGWAAQGFDDSGWPVMSLPAFWQGHPGMNFNGVVWFRRTVALPTAWQGQSLSLELGAIDDFDDTYVNGERVGGLGREIPESYQVPRCYPIPAHLTSAGTLSIAVRVFDHFGSGGFRGMPDELRLVGPGAPEGALPLHGDWRYQVEHRLAPLPPDLFSTRPWVPPGVRPQDRPAHAYNAMIHPLRPWSWRGALWYQGESNGGRAADYADLLRALIAGWREAFDDPVLPFLLVQLPNYAGGADWPLIREAQDAVRDLPHTAVAVTLDVGDAADIHPLRKQPVGDRLAGLALHDVYGQPVAARGPEARAVESAGSVLRIHFDHAEGGLVTTDGAAPRGFEVCGPDAVYRAAEARLDGERVRVSHPRIDQPAGVRYAFAAAPNVNLTNRHGLPAAPFRRDPPGVAEATGTRTPEPA